MSSGTCNLPEDVLCGCCAGLTQQTPQAITNRPALFEVSYRVGTYSTFLTSMLAALSDPDLPALSALRTRDSSDFTIALLDAWAVSLDVLTFYQERFANEAFLRTAVDQRSVFELARLIGYVPSPGVAASAVLAFTLSSATGSPDDVLIPAGTRVQSVPGPNQTPQIFETSSDLTAVIALNALPAQTHLPWQLNPGDTSTWITGAANNINVGDALLFIATDSSGLPDSAGPADLRYISSVQINSGSGNTQIWWNAPLANTTPAATDNVAIYIFRKKAALFGAQAINPFLLPSETLANIPGAPPTSVSATSLQPETRLLGSIGSIAGPIDVGRFRIWTDWDFQPTSSNQVNLDGAYAGLAPAGSAPDQSQWMVLTNADETAVFQVTAASESNPNRYALSAKTSLLTLSSSVIVLAGSPGNGLPDALDTFSDDTRSTTAYVTSESAHSCRAADHCMARARCLSSRSRNGAPHTGRFNLGRGRAGDRSWAAYRYFRKVRAAAGHIRRSCALRTCELIRRSPGIRRPSLSGECLPACDGHDRPFALVREHFVRGCRDALACE